MVMTGGWDLWWGTPAAQDSGLLETLPDHVSLMASGLQNLSAYVSPHKPQQNNNNNNRFSDPVSTFTLFDLPFRNV